MLKDKIIFRHKDKSENIQIGWYICTICQLKCPYCTTRKYHKNNLNKICSKKEIDLVLEKFRNLDKEIHLVITGGEPALSPYLSYIINEINKIQSIRTYEVFTNGLNSVSRYNISEKGRFIFSFHPLVSNVDTILNHISEVKDKFNLTANIMITDNLDQTIINKYINYCLENNILVHTQTPYINYKVKYNINNYIDQDKFIIGDKTYSTNELYKLKLNSFKGWCCYMGSYDILPNLDILDNCYKKVIGKIDDLDKLEVSPRICEKDQCTDEELLYYEKVLYR